MKIFIALFTTLILPSAFAVPLKFNSLVCSGDGEQFLTLNRISHSRKKTPAQYYVSLTKEAREVFPPERIYRTIFSKDSTGPIATVFINDRVVLYIPFSQPKDAPAGQFTGTLEIQGQENQTTVVCNLKPNAMPLPKEY